MPQTLTELFSNLTAAPQTPNIAPATYNGVIKSSPTVQTFNSPLQIAAPASVNPTGTYENFLMGEQPGGLINPNPVILRSGMIVGDGSSSLGEAFVGKTPKPEIKIAGGDLSLASPFRNTGSTRIIG